MAIGTGILGCSFDGSTLGAVEVAGTLGASAVTGSDPHPAHSSATITPIATVCFINVTVLRRAPN